MKPLILYTRPHCTLCAELEYDLHTQFSGRYALQRRDVDDDERWRDEFGLRIPVLAAPNGRVLCEIELDESAVADYLQTD